MKFKCKGHTYDKQFKMPQKHISVETYYEPKAGPWNFDALLKEYTTKIVIMPSYGGISTGSIGSFRNNSRKTVSLGAETIEVLRCAANYLTLGRY